MLKLHLLLVIALFQFVSAESLTDVINIYNSYLEPVKKDCIGHSKVDPELIGVGLFEDGFKDDNDLEVFIMCCFLELGIIDLEGNIYEDELNDFAAIGDPAFQQVYDTCKDVEGMNVGELAVNLSICLYEYIKFFVNEDYETK